MTNNYLAPNPGTWIAVNNVYVPGSPFIADAPREVRYRLVSEKKDPFRHVGPPEFSYYTGDFIANLHTSERDLRHGVTWSYCPCSKGGVPPSPLTTVCPNHIEEMANCPSKIILWADDMHRHHTR